MIKLIAVFMLAVPAIAQEREFVIDEYEFIWTAYRIQDVELAIIKDETSTRFSLRGDGWFPMSAEEALQLAETLDMALGLEITGVDTNKVVLYELVKKPPFSIWNMREGRLRIGRTNFGGEGQIVLTREEAKGILPHLDKAPKMIAFVDSLIRF